MEGRSSVSSSRPPSTPASVYSSSPGSELDGVEPFQKLTASDLLAMQIRAFIEAAEEVDIDSETIDDILQTLSADDQLAAITDSEDDQESFEDPLTIPPKVLDISALYSYPEQDQTAKWTKQEIRQMMTALKERGMSYFVNEYVKKRCIPIPELLQAFGITLCPQLRAKQPKTLLFFLRVAAWRELCLREKLEQYNTIDDAVDLIRKSNRIIILTGAGISVSCGIPDFRSRDGLYATLANRSAFELDDPQQMFDIQYFKENPAVFYAFASQIYPSNFTPSPCHRFIKLIEDRGKLLRNYTQNIDTLETLSGVRNVLQCHGSFATASCVNCRRRVPGSEIEVDILKQKVPLCTACNSAPAEVAPTKNKQKGKKKRKSKSGWDSDAEDESDVPEYPPGIMKPDITFFGEKLTDDFDNSLEKDREHVDLLLVIGTSLKVSPVADILSHLPHSVPQILINKTPVKHINPDIVLLGDADVVVQHLAKRLSWDIPPPPPPAPTTTTRLYPARNLKKRPSTDTDPADEQPRRVADSHIWLFSGADGGKWLETRQKEYETSRKGSTEDLIHATTGAKEGDEFVRQAKRVKKI